uniref:SH3 domain-containing protein n=1 Tax=Phasianus colchicus TaxID=9054 RepID=A0A669R437_PHACC
MESPPSPAHHFAQGASQPLESQSSATGASLEDELPPDTLGRAPAAEESPRSHYQAAVHSPLPGPQVGAALQQTFQHVLRWGDQLSRAFLGADSFPGAVRPEAGPWDTGAGPSSWWAQLSQASRIYTAPSKERFPFVWWTKRRTTAGDSSPGQAARPQTPPREPKGTELWVGKAFPNELMASFALCRRPSSWLAPSSRVLAVVVKGLAEKSRAPEQPEKKLPDSPQSHRAVRALCDHIGAADGHLSFQKGDILQLLSTVDEDWIRCCHGNNTGLVPVGYTSLIL